MESETVDANGVTRRDIVRNARNCRRIPGDTSKPHHAMVIAGVAEVRKRKKITNETKPSLVFDFVFFCFKITAYINIIDTP